MKFLADENVEWTVVETIRSFGYDVLAAHHDLTGTTDEKLLEIALRDDRILVTNDTDFGTLVFYRKQVASGIVLMRFLNENTSLKRAMIEHLLKHHAKKLKNHFTVVSEKQIRIKPLTE
jgi:predicted nuclease of predicted toxin-antitoxin system